MESAKTLVMPKVMPVNVLPKDDQSANLQTAILEGADKARFGEMIAKLQRQPVYNHCCISLGAKKEAKATSTTLTSICWAGFRYTLSGQRSAYQ
ncbi:MAG: hypothetical protein LRY40_00230 [Shewanella fodinae]|nr:hypothetical protein [Shewanella fodinae]